MTPLMRDTFGHHHRLSESDRESLWKTCTFALDANCLLNIYRYADSTRSDLFRVLKGLTGRIWIPYQAAKEFYKNRVEIIREQRSKYDTLESGLNETLSDLRGGEFRKSAFLKIEDIEAILKPAIEQAKVQISKRRAEHPDLLHDDPYLEQFVAIVGESVGQEPDQKHFEECCAKANERIEKQQPPGYRDAKKPTPERYGDVLIWFELPDHAQSTKKPIVLITDDEKDDWWQIVGGEKLGPRPELREEMRKVSGVEFYLANPAYFLEKVGEQLKVDVSKSSVDDAEKVAAESRVRVQLRIPPETRIQSDTFVRRPNSDELLAEIQQFSSTARNAVKKWIISRFGGSRILERGSNHSDFTLRVRSGQRIGVGVLSYRGMARGLVMSRAREAFLRAHYEISEGNIEDFALFVVTQRENTAREIMSWVTGGRVEPCYSLSAGILSPDEEYIELARFEDSGSLLFDHGLQIDNAEILTAEPESNA